MPEQAAWRFSKITKPMFDIPTRHLILKGRVLTCVGTEVIEQGYVEIAEGKIKAVGKASELSNNAGTEVIETNGTILPGMFNCHAHLSWDGIHDLANQSMFDSPEIAAYKAAGNMLISLRSGITTVRDLGVNKSNFASKQAVEQGIFPGPRLLITGESIVQTGGHTYWVCREASGPDEMRRAVRDQVKGGADLIKIMACHDLLEFTDEELFAVIDEAHRNGLPTTAHATFDECISRVVKAGIDVIEHGGKMSDETIQLLLDRKVPIVTTFSAVVMQSQAEIARKYNIPEWKIQERQKAMENTSSYDSLVKAAKAGVPIAFGTDAGSPVVQHNVVVPEMKYMIKLGVVDGNYGAIRSATIVAANLTHLEKKLGSLEVGKLADVIVVDGNPLADLSALENVRMTFKEGKQLV
jgi:imidazolonepropionase-like amidohydrolase